jgi:hypothetical protein
MLDHLILPVNDRDASVDFYVGVLGPTLYCFDPSKHLIEIRYCADAPS